MNHKNLSKESTKSNKRKNLDSDESEYEDVVRSKRQRILNKNYNVDTRNDFESNEYIEDEFQSPAGNENKNTINNSFMEDCSASDDGNKYCEINYSPPPPSPILTENNHPILTPPPHFDLPSQLVERLLNFCQKSY